MTLSSIVGIVRKTFPENFEIRYLHPTLYLVCKDSAFAILDDTQRQKLFVERTGLTPDVFDLPGLASALSFLLLTPDERKREYDFLDAATPGQHWLPLLDPSILADEAPATSTVPRAIHFYGYKGGQARSTVLAMLARQLADNGYKVLCVDADVEAPSLDILLNVAANNPNRTLLGLVAPGQSIEPIAAYTATPENGSVDLLACRPASPDYDMDFAAFVLRTAFDVTALENGIQRLHQHIQSLSSEKRHDVVLFDHRSGLTTSVLPIIKAYPGPVVICLRIDEQSRRAAALFKILLTQVTDTPGAFVSFSLDPEETREKMLGVHAAQVNELLDLLGSAIERGSSGEGNDREDSPPEDFLSYWISWFHDRAFLEKVFPALSEISDQNRRSLLQLREVLAFSGKKAPTVIVRSRTKGRVHPKLSPSGAGDEGVFIETQEIARLFQPNTSIVYIFGRKGTGKTRLLQELQTRNLGEPLVVAADAQGGGLASGDALFSDLKNACEGRPENLWWCILAAALESTSCRDNTFRENLKLWEHRARSKRNPIRISEIADLAAALPSRRVFLIDGIETAFSAAQLIEFVETLFKFLLTVQSDAHFSGHVIVRLFLRTDLAKRAIQNVEQQTAGRRLDLTWNTQSIFNFVLSRILQIPWFQENFPEACSAIERENTNIRAGLLSSSEYEPLLLEVFPRHLRRNNLQTLTFLKTYFSDAAGDDETRAAFYPRLFDAFLNCIADKSQLPHGAAPEHSLEDGRIHQALILAAHEAASRKFLDEVKQELSVLLDLAKRPSENEQRVTSLLSAFDGLNTPFQLERRLKELHELVPKIEPSSLREALLRMKEIGMFEDRPGYSGWWRAGRLFKSALRMKYVR